jgi:molybdopterin-guanine dinucleotide biosynthesis protein A
MAEPTFGVILAGGLARRLGGGDKALRRVGGQTVLTRLIGRLAPQVTRLILNANADAARFNEFGLPVVSDDLPDRPGPLAGVLAGLDWTAQFAPDVQWVVTAPGDAPFLPLDLVARLHAARGKATLACAASGGQTHPVAALWPVALRHDLRHALTVEKLHKVGAYIRRHDPAIAEWPTQGVDPFFNVNTPADLAEADRLAGALRD